MLCFTATSTDRSYLVNTKLKSKLHPPHNFPHPLLGYLNNNCSISTSFKEQMSSSSVDNNNHCYRCRHKLSLLPNIIYYFFLPNHAFEFSILVTVRILFYNFNKFHISRKCWKTRACYGMEWKAIFPYSMLQNFFHSISIPY